MDHYHHLTIEQRENLLVCVNQGKKYAEIAAEIHCSESTVSREIRRNSASRQEYSAIKAQRAYEKRRKNSVRKPVLADPKAVQTVSNLLEMAWSPEQISNRLKYEHNQLKISTSTIYRRLMRAFWTKNFAKSSVSREDCATAEEKRANVDIWTSNIPSMTGLNLLINVKQLAIGKATQFEDQSGLGALQPM